MADASARKEAKLILSIAEEAKKVSYLGAAGPYLLFGDQAKTVVGASTLIVIALVWFIMVQLIAHALMALAEKMETNDV